MDGNPNLVEDMLDLDSSRTAASRINCTVSNCNTSLLERNATYIDSSNRIPQSLVQECQNGNSDTSKANQEGGWSTVGPRKIKKRKEEMIGMF
jgi:hypothetical protein